LTEKVDIWALGVLLYKLCFFTTPFESEGSKLAILNGRYQIPPNSYFSSRMIQLIRFLLTDHPAARPDVYQTLSYVCEMRGVPCPIQNIYLGVQEAPPELPPKDFPRERKRQMLAINDDLSGILLTANHQSQQSAQSGMRRGRHGRGGGGDPNTVDAAANRQPSNLISSNHPSKQLNDLFGIPASDTHTIEYGVSVDKPQIDSKPKQAIDEIFGFLDSKSMPTAESFARSNVFDNDIQFNPLSDNPHAAVASPDLFGSTEPRQKPESRRPSIHAAAKQNSPLGDPQGLQFGSNVKNNDPFDFTTIVSSASRPKTPMLTVSPMPSNFLLPAAPTSANAISAVQELNDIFGASGINVGGGNPSPKTAAASGGSYWDSQ
jgi:hypothetical protein